MLSCEIASIAEGSGRSFSLLAPRGPRSTVLCMSKKKELSY